MTIHEGALSSRAFNSRVVLRFRDKHCTYAELNFREPSEATAEKGVRGVASAPTGAGHWLKAAMYLGIQVQWHSRSGCLLPLFQGLSHAPADH